MYRKLVIALSLCELGAIGTVASEWTRAEEAAADGQGKGARSRTRFMLQVRLTIRSECLTACY